MFVCLFVFRLNSYSSKCSTFAWRIERHAYQPANAASRVWLGILRPSALEQYKSTETVILAGRCTSSSWYSWKSEHERNHHKALWERQANPWGPDERGKCFAGKKNTDAPWFFFLFSARLWWTHKQIHKHSHKKKALTVQCLKNNTKCGSGWLACCCCFTICSIRTHKNNICLLHMSSKISIGPIKERKTLA